MEHVGPSNRDGAGEPPALPGMFYGVGVGPGPAGLVPVCAWKALQTADVIMAPRAKGVQQSVARQTLDGLNLPEERFVDVAFNMDSERENIEEHYAKIAQGIVEELNSGKTVAYLTIGDSLTYSTYSYTLEALLKLKPDLKHKTFPGVTSFATIAAALDWPIGQGKERVLILPCPDTAEELKEEIRTHDIIVLMKIGARLPMVLSVVKELSLESQCAFGSRIGLANEVVSDNLEEFERSKASGYLTTMLIRSRVCEEATS